MTPPLVPQAAEKERAIRDGLTSHKLVFVTDERRPQVRNAVDDPACPHCIADAALDSLAAELVTLRDALEEIHEQTCGCDEPGRSDVCASGLPELSVLGSLSSGVGIPTGEASA